MTSVREETENNFYTILEIPQNASPEDIKKSYRRLSLKYHPDKTQGNPALTEKFQKINDAYETLGCQEKRYEYDNMNARMPSGMPPGMPSGVHFFSRGMHPFRNGVPFHF